MDIANFFANYWILILVVLIVFSGLFTINQGYIGVVTMFR